MLSFPGHVLVQIGEQNPAVIDPFAGGRLMSQQEIAKICRTRFGKEKGTLSALRMSNRDVLARLLNNQALRAENGNDLHRALEVYRRITRIAPGVLDAWQKLARLELALNDVTGARASLFAMSEIAPDKKTRERIIDAFEALGPTKPISP